MSLVPSMCTLSQRRWVDAWEAEQAILDRLGADRDTWLPHVVESREWGVLRWTSGRPEQAAETGTAVAETFAVLSPDATSAQHRAAARALRSSPPVVTVLGKGLRRSTLLAAASFGVIGVALGLLLGSVTGAGALGIIAWVLFLLLLGVAAGAASERALRRFHRNRVLIANDSVRLVTGRYAPASWERLIRAVTAVEITGTGPSGSSGEPPDQGTPGQQTMEVRAAVWEAAGLLLASSDHAGIDVLADGVERLARR